MPDGAGSRAATGTATGASAGRVSNANAAPADLVFVGRTNATTGRANLAGTAARFTRLIDGDVVRENQRTGLGNAKAAADIQASAFEFFDFLEQRFGREHDAVADVASDVLVHDPRRDQAQNGLLATDDERVSGIVTTLETHHALRVIGQPIDDLTLAFVAPLGSDNDDVASLIQSIAGHNNSWFG